MNKNSMFCVVVVMFVMLSSISLAYPSVEMPITDIDKVLFSDFEISLKDWNENSSFSIKRSGVSFYMKKTTFGGFQFRGKEYENREVFVSVEINRNIIDGFSIGSFSSDNGIAICWSVNPLYTYINFTLTPLADEHFELGAGKVLKFKVDGGYRARFRSLVHGQSVKFSVACDANSPNVFVNISKTFDFNGRNISVDGNAFVVKYKVKHGFNYPINQNRGNPTWYEVRDIDSYNIQLVVHFTRMKSGDLVVVINPVWYDYITAVGLLDLFGWTEPVASLGDING